MALELLVAVVPGSTSPGPSCPVPGCRFSCSSESIRPIDPRPPEPCSLSKAARLPLLPEGDQAFGLGANGDSFPLGIAVVLSLLLVPHIPIQDLVCLRKRAGSRSVFQRCQTSIGVIFGVINRTPTTRPCPILSPHHIYLQRCGVHHHRPDKDQAMIMK